MNDLYTALPFLVYTLIGVILATNYKKWLKEEDPDPRYPYSIIDFLTMMVFWLPLFFYALLRWRK